MSERKMRVIIFMIFFGSPKSHKKNQMMDYHQILEVDFFTLNEKVNSNIKCPHKDQTG